MELLRREWRILTPPREQAKALGRAVGAGEVVGRVLWNRGVRTPQQARQFLNPSLSGLVGPEEIPGVMEAAEVVGRAVEEGKVVGVAGDYDADGVCATALMVELIRGVGGRVVWDLPDRVADGYGFGPERARRLKGMGAEVVVTVDCGISDREGVQEARRLGMDVVITDHHQPPPGPLPQANAIVDPWCSGGVGTELAGVGVAAYLAMGLRAWLRRRGWFAVRPEPRLMGMLELVALGTCADIVPLTGLNRLLVAEGLKVMAHCSRPGLKALVASARLKRVGGRQVGFVLGPRLNAAGRVSHPSLALRLLLCREPAEAERLASELERLNRSRQEIEGRILKEVSERLEPEAGCIVLAGEGWHRGVVGIVASRVVEQVGRPVVLLAVEGDKAVGSARSVPGFHIQRALAGISEMLISFGGHELAAGLSIRTSLIPQLAKALEDAALKALGRAPVHSPLVVDALTNLEEVVEVGRYLEKMEPFGEANPEPLLAARVRVERLRELNGGHLRMELVQERWRLPAVAFRPRFPRPRPGQELVAAFHLGRGRAGLEAVVVDMREEDVVRGRG